MKIRYVKVIRDLTSDVPKNVMLVVAIAIGVFGVGAILGAHGVLTREMASNYSGTHPASATIELEDDISQGLLDSVRLLPGIAVAERHATVVSRMKVGDKWYPILLFVIDDFTDKKTNLVYHLTGDRQPSTGAMVVERTALTVMNAREGEEITIKTPLGRPMAVQITGTVHDPGLAPAWQEQAGYGYITLSTLHWLGESRGFDQLRIRIDHDTASAQAIVERCRNIAAWLQVQGHKVHEVQVPPPGKHPHQSQMNAVLSIFTIFSFLLLVLGSILVATSLATLMVKQVRQIGVMKTVGADTRQIAGIYVVMMLSLCIGALLIAIPLSRIAAAIFYQRIAVLLNLELVDTGIPAYVPLIQVLSGIAIPLLAAAIPVVRGSRISVRQALDNYGVNLRTQGRESRWLRVLKLSGQTFTLSLRNVFRQRSRLVMTLGLLAAGGAMFMTALNVSDAWDENLERIYSQRQYDLEIRLNERVDTTGIVSRLSSIEGIRAVEAWDYAPTSFSKGEAFEINHTYPDKGHGSFTMVAVPISSTLLRPTVVAGRWLRPGKRQDVVLNQLARSYAGGVRIGDSVLLTTDGRVRAWTVVGFTEDVGSAAAAYVSIENFSSAPGQTRMLRIAYDDRSRENASAMNQTVEASLARGDVPVLSATPVWVLHNAVAAHMKVLVNSLVAMAVLMAVVGTLGLTSAMSMSVMERTREIGVMRAIGGTPRTIRTIILVEGLVIASFSMLLAFILSLVLSYFMGRFIGSISFRTPLTLNISLAGVSIWTLILLIGTLLATLLPAQRAGRVTTREALAYE